MSSNTESFDVSNIYWFYQYLLFKDAGRSSEAFFCLLIFSFFICLTYFYGGVEGGATFFRGAMVKSLSLWYNFIQQSLDSGSA